MQRWTDDDPPRPPSLAAHILPGLHPTSPRKAGNRCARPGLPLAATLALATWLLTAVWIVLVLVALVALGGPGGLP